MSHTSNVQISVIVPVYNSASMLRRCLDSLKKQDFSAVEFICVDDGSTDESFDIMQEYQKEDKRFLIYSKENGGVSSARNFGLDHANGDYIMFLDSDDWYDANTCRVAFELIQSHDADVGMFCVEMEYKDRAEYRAIISDKVVTWHGDECKNLHRRCIGLIGEELIELMKFDYMSLVYLKIYRRDIIEREQIRFFDIRQIGTFEDGYFNVEYFSHITSAVYSPRSLYHYNRVNPMSITTRYSPSLPEQWSNLFIILQSHIDRISDMSLQEALNNRIAYATLGLGLNVMNGPITKKEKYLKINDLLHSEYLHQCFSKRDRRFLPLPFRIFFAMVARKWNFGVYGMLWLMTVYRNKNKGLA